MAPNWHLARTKPMSEYLAAAALQRSGYELYFPRVQTPRPRAGHEDMPLFPGYLFIKQRVEEDLPAIERMAGLAGWVQFEGVVPEVPDEVINELAQRVDAINNNGGCWTRYRAGERVRVRSGYIDTLAQVVEEVKSPRSRVRVLLDFMGQLVKARVPWQDIYPSANDELPRPFDKPQRRTRGKGRWIRGYGPRAVVSST